MFKLTRAKKRQIARFTVTGANEAGVDKCFNTTLRALLCKSCCCYANQYFFSKISITKRKRFVAKQGQPQPHVHSKARLLRACLHGGGGPQVGEVTRLGGVTRLSI